jgi:hypothetical protein
MFWPELHIPHYRNRLSEEKQADMDKRARKLFRRAVQNQIFGASEYIWEADAWHDVFGSIRDDDTFRMLYLFLDVNAIVPISKMSDSYLRDKRPYDFVDDAHGNKLVKRRIPDATMGLRTYKDLDLDHGYRINHDGTRPNKSLMEYRIRKQMWDRKRGLIVDGVWGDNNLIFPFAVYEAKKHASTLEQAKEQVYHAFRVYLAMLDDLARDPLDVTQYQSEESTCYQLFGFISCGSYWEVYVAYNRDGRCVSDTPFMVRPASTFSLSRISTWTRYGRAISKTSIEHVSSSVLWIKSMTSLLTSIVNSSSNI